jgi:hypothetical protein
MSERARWQAFRRREARLEHREVARLLAVRAEAVPVGVGPRRRGGHGDAQARRLVLAPRAAVNMLRQARCQCSLFVRMLLMDAYLKLGLAAPEFQ